MGTLRVLGEVDDGCRRLGEETFTDHSVKFAGELEHGLGEKGAMTLFRVPFGVRGLFAFSRFFRC